MRLDSGSKMEAAGDIQEFTIARTWVSYRGRKNGTATAKEVDFATPGARLPTRRK